MATQKEFRRSLLDASLARLKERPGAGLLGYCAADPDLSVFLRGDALDVYWEGLVVFHVALPSGRLQVGSGSDRPPQSFPRNLKDLTPSLIPTLVGWVKDHRAKKIGTIPELRFESRVVRDNRGQGSPVLVIDRQIARPGISQRLDLLLLDVGSKRLALAELKADGNAETTGAILDQLDRYGKTFGNDRALRADYETHLGQLKDLGVITNGEAGIDVDREPLAIVMLAGFSVKSLGGGTTRGHFKKLLAKKKASYPTADVRMVTFPHWVEGTFTLPTPLSHLPTVEEWSDLYL